MSRLNCLRGTRSRKAVALAAFAFSISCFPAPAAPAATDPADPAAAAPAPGVFRALSYLKPDSGHLMMHLDNPRQERVTVLVLNEHRDVVYRRSFGQPATFIGKFNLTGLPNGEYTFVVKGSRGSHTRNILVETATERVLRLQ